MAGGHGGGGSERWLVTYADMLTLLLAFFIILYSISKADINRFEKFQEGMAKAFHVGVLSGHDPTSFGDTSAAQVGLNGSSLGGPVAVTTPNTTSQSAIVIGSAASSPLLVPIVARTPVPKTLVGATPVAAPIPDHETAVMLRDKLQGIIPNTSLEGIVVQESSEGIIISMYGVLLFDAGSSDLLPAGRNVLRQVASLIRGLPYDIRVEGNTDSIQPDPNGPFATNWELSTNRALTVTHALIDDSKIDPARLSAVGHAEFRPVATNATREGRLRNRRVDLILVQAASRPNFTVSPTPTASGQR